jgi:hypothetical protein
MGAPGGNTNAEKWTFEEAEKLFIDALELSKTDDYDFIGEIAKELDTYRQLFDYLCTKYSGLQNIYNKILNNLESNCFLHAKKGKIKEATAIVNLKSNFNWTDRQREDHTGTINLNVKYEDKGS